MKNSNILYLITNIVVCVTNKIVISRTPFILFRNDSWFVNRLCGRFIVDKLLLRTALLSPSWYIYYVLFDQTFDPSLWHKKSLWAVTLKVLIAFGK